MAYWYERACEQLESEYEAGEIDHDTFNKEMRNLNRELEDAAMDAARDTYNDYMG